jgi:hypothetical protein
MVSPMVAQVNRGHGLILGLTTSKLSGADSIQRVSVLNFEIRTMQILTSVPAYSNEKHVESV